MGGELHTKIHTWGKQINSVDFCSRRAKRIEKSNDEPLSEVLSISDACIYRTPDRVLNPA
jgi:hypothetical protein